MRHDDDRRRYGPEVRWPGVLRAALPDGTTLIEEGLPGRTTVHDDPIEGAHKNGLTVLPALLESHRDIDLVLLKLGTNDWKARFSVTASDVARSIELLIAAVQMSECGPDETSPGVLVIVSPPIEERGWLAGMFAGGAAKSALAAAEIAKIASGRQAGFFDAGERISVSPVDGVHYEAEMHETLGKALAPVVLGLLK